MQVIETRSADNHVPKKIDPNLRKKILEETIAYLTSVKEDINYYSKPELLEQTYEIGSELIDSNGDINETKLGEFLAASSQSPKKFDALCWVGAGALRMGTGMPAALRNFLADVLSDRVARPLGSRGRKSYDRRRNSFLIAAIDQIICNYPIFATQSDDKKPKNEHQDSACDIVAEAMTNLGLTPASVDEIKDIWEARVAGVLISKPIIM